MKRLFTLIILSTVLMTGGCGKEDLNKDLKPVDPNAPRPTPSGGSQPGGKQPPANEKQGNLKPGAGVQ